MKGGGPTGASNEYRLALLPNGRLFSDVLLPFIERWYPTRTTIR